MLEWCAALGVPLRPQPDHVPLGVRHRHREQRLPRRPGPEAVDQPPARLLPRNRREPTIPRARPRAGRQDVHTSTSSAPSTSSSTSSAASPPRTGWCTTSPRSTPTTGGLRSRPPLLSWFLAPSTCGGRTSDAHLYTHDTTSSRSGWGVVQARLRLPLCSLETPSTSTPCPCCGRAGAAALGNPGRRGTTAYHAAAAGVYVRRGLGPQPRGEPAKSTGSRTGATTASSRRRLASCGTRPSGCGLRRRCARRTGDARCCVWWLAMSTRYLGEILEAAGVVLALGPPVGRLAAVAVPALLRCPLGPARTRRRRAVPAEIRCPLRANTAKGCASPDRVSRVLRSEGSGPGQQLRQQRRQRCAVAAVNCRHRVIFVHDFLTSNNAGASGTPLAFLAAAWLLRKALGAWPGLLQKGLCGGSWAPFPLLFSSRSLDYPIISSTFWPAPHF